MKVFINKLAQYTLLVLLSIVITSCSDTKKFMYSIPADTDQIYAININNISEKSGIHKKKNKDIKNQILEVLKKDINSDDYKQIEKIINNPSKSGIDTKTPVYFFNAPSIPYNTIAANLKSSKQLKRFFKVLENQGVCEPLINEDKYNYTVIGNHWFVIFDKNTVIAIEATSNKIEAAKKQAISLFTLPKEESIVQKQANTFKEFRKNTGDFIFFYSLNHLKNNYKRQIESAFDIKLDTDITLVGSLNMNKGETALSVKFQSEKEDLFANKQIYLKKLSGSLLEFFPSNTIALINLGINGKNLYKDILNNTENTKDFIQQKETRAIIETIYGNKTYSEFLKNPELLRNWIEDKNVKKFIEGINGDISIGAFTMGVDKAKPNFLALIEANTKGVNLDSLLSNEVPLNTIKNEDLIKLKENEYLLRNIKFRKAFSQYLSSDLFVGIKKGFIYVTNNELIYKDLGNKIDKTMKGEPITKNLKGKRFFTTFNFEEILDLPFIKLMTLLGNDETKNNIENASHFTHLDILNEDKSDSFEIILYQSDTKQTVLELFLDRIKNILPIAQ